MKSYYQCNLSWTTVFAAAMFGMLLSEFVRIIAPHSANNLLLYSNDLILILAGVYFAKRSSNTPIEIKLYIWYLAWALVSRWLNHDLSLFADHGLLVVMLYSFLFLCVGTVLSAKQREVFLDCLSFVFIVFFTLAALAGIYVCVKDSSILLPPENVSIAVFDEGYLRSLNLFSMVRTYSVSWLFLTWNFLVYQLFKRKNIIVRLLLMICMAIVHFTMPLFHSRNIQICLSICYGMLTLLIFSKLLRRKPQKIRIAVLPVITVAAVALCFFSFHVCLAYISAFRSAAEPQFNEVYEIRENKIDSDHPAMLMLAVDKSSESDFINAVPLTAIYVSENTSSTENGFFQDPRSITEDNSMTGRTYIWKSGLVVLKENPDVLLYGRLSNQVMPMVNDILHNRFGALTTQDEPHMHNAFLEVLMLFGIPGLLLVLLWTVHMVKKMLLVFFSDDGRFTLAEKALTIPIAGLFVFNLAEVIIFAHFGGTSGYTFYLISGLFLGCFYHKTKKLPS